MQHHKLPNNCPCKTPSLKPAMQHVALQAARKLEQLCTFRNVVRQVAACDMSSTSWRVILQHNHEPISVSFARGRFRDDDSYRLRCRFFLTKTESVWHLLCNFPCSSFVMVACKLQEKLSGVIMAFSPDYLGRCARKFPFFLPNWKTIKVNSCTPVRSYVLAI